MDISVDAINDEKRRLIYSAHIRLAQISIAVENKRVKPSPSMAGQRGNQDLISSRIGMSFKPINGVSE